MQCFLGLEMIGRFLFGETDEQPAILIVGLLEFLSLTLFPPVVQTLEVAIGFEGLD